MPGDVGAVVCTEIAVVADVAHAMDVARRRERADIADLISLWPTRLRSAVDQLLMLATWMTPNPHQVT
jgi:hypothetical protein